MQFTTSEIIVLLFCAITLILSVVTLITVLKKNNNNRTEDELQRILLNQQSFAQSQNDRAVQLEQRLHSFSADNVQSLENIRRSVDEKLESIRRENLRQLDEMRQTVDEKLQKTLEEKMNKSFSLVNERLEQVYKGLGEMQTLAVGVGDLKKVLSNVKTRGILGEIQLGAILSEILTKEQYEENIATKKGSKNVVEFAIKLPADGAGTVYLPVDSKFPGDTYSALRDAVESCDKQRIESAQKALVQRIKGEVHGNIRKCNLLKQIIFLRQHPIPMLPLLLFFPFFRPLPLFFFLLFHHPQSPEKRTQHLRALFFQHAALDLHLMVKFVHFQHI